MIDHQAVDAALRVLADTGIEVTVSPVVVHGCVPDPADVLYATITGTSLPWEAAETAVREALGPLADTVSVVHLHDQLEEEPPWPGF